MRTVPAFCCTAALIITLALAGTTTGAATKKHMAMKSSSGALVAKGKTLVTAKHCDACHGPDLKGKANFSPSLHAGTRPMTEYNQTTFVRLLTKGLDNGGAKVKSP